MCLFTAVSFDDTFITDQLRFVLERNTVTNKLSIELLKSVRLEAIVSIIARNWHSSQYIEKIGSTWCLGPQRSSIKDNKMVTRSTILV